MNAVVYVCGAVNEPGQMGRKELLLKSRVTSETFDAAGSIKSLLTAILRSSASLWGDDADNLHPHKYGPTGVLLQIDVRRFVWWTVMTSMHDGGIEIERFRRLCMIARELNSTLLASSHLPQFRFITVCYNPRETWIGHDIRNKFVERLKREICCWLKRLAKKFWERTFKNIGRDPTRSKKMWWRTREKKIWCLVLQLSR